MNENKWWHQGVQIFGQVSAWVAGPIVLALIFGKMLDKHYGTEPMVFLALTAIAFIISIAGILKILKKYIKEIEKEIKEKNGNRDSST